tara:strand:+ start:329 stop:445 length:117 start_codon:yes stop_codon:yes gene_type:complete
MSEKTKAKLWTIGGWLGFIIISFIYYAAIAPIIKLIFK